MKITEILNENKELEYIRIPEGTEVLTEVSKLRGVKKVKTLDASKVKSLVSLEGCPDEVDELLCAETSIPSFKGGPKKAVKIVCYNNASLISLEGCPEEVDELWCSKSLITSLNGVPKRITKVLTIGYNSQLILTNVWEDLHYCDTYAHVGTIHSDSGLLGLLRVNGLKKIGCDNKSPLSIVAKYVPLRSMSDIVRCKQELIEAGFRSNAKF